MIKPEQLPTLLQGFKPREMEDKWFVYADGPDDDGLATMHFHRSWTGYKMTEISIQIGKSGAKDKDDEGSIQITSITWETGGEAQRHPSENGAKETVESICKWILGVELRGD